MLRSLQRVFSELEVRKLLQPGKYMRPELETVALEAEVLQPREQGQRCCQISANSSAAVRCRGGAWQLQTEVRQLLQMLQVRQKLPSPCCRTSCSPKSEKLALNDNQCQVKVLQLSEGGQSVWLNDQDDTKSP